MTTVTHSPAIAQNVFTMPTDGEITRARLSALGLTTASDAQAAESAIHAAQSSYGVFAVAIYRRPKSITVKMISADQKKLITDNPHLESKIITSEPQLGAMLRTGHVLTADGELPSEITARMITSEVVRISKIKTPDGKGTLGYPAVDKIIRKAFAGGQVAVWEALKAEKAPKINKVPADSDDTGGGTGGGSEGGESGSTMGDTSGTSNGPTHAEILGLAARALADLVLTGYVPSVEESAVLDGMRSALDTLTARGVAADTASVTVDVVAIG